MIDHNFRKEIPTELALFASLCLPWASIKPVSIGDFKQKLWNIRF